MTNNIFNRRFLIFFTLLFAAISLIIWFFFNIFNIHEQRINDVLEVEAMKVERALVDRIENTHSIIKSMNLQIMQKPYSKDHIHKILKQFKSTPELNDIFSWTIFSWSDASYNLIVDAKYGIMDESFDLSIRDYISLTKSNPGKIHLGSPVFGSTSKKWMIPGGVGLIDNNGKYLGAVVIGFEINSLAKSIYKNISNYDIAVEIINDNGISILEVDAKYSGIPRHDNPYKSSVTSKIIDNYDGKKDSVNIDLIRNKGAFLITKLNETPYSLIISYDQESINNSLWESLFSRSLEILIMFLVSITLLIIVHRVEKERRKKLIYARRAAESANRTKDKILFSISHDIKNYIFGIGGLGKMIIDSKKRSEVLENEDLQTVETICDQVEELGYFVEDLLDINHVQAGGLSLGVAQKVKIRDLIGTVLTFSKSLASDNAVSLKSKIDNNVPEFNCDPRRMKQVLINLVGNAIKYSKPNGEVVVETKYLKDKNQLYIEVSDQGFGMTPEEIKLYLSGKGGRIDKSNIEKVKAVDSHGIGVPIILRLVKLHNGIIKIDSTKDAGTKVKIYFDLSKTLKIKSGSSSQEDEITPNKNNKVNSKNKLILLVEDNPVNIKVTCKLLEQEGYEVIYAENGKDSLKMIEKYHPDLILMDGEMPVMNGYDATKNIRDGMAFKSFRNFRTIPIIGFMSSSSEIVIKKSMDYGMSDHVEKSTSRTKLMDAIVKNLA